MDVRVIATTNRELFAMVEDGRFREDLFFRLNVIPLQLPPLRERKGDIPLLADHFIRKHAGRNGRKPAAIAPEAMEMLCHYNWRGNIRELENVMERALLLCEDDDIQPAHLMMGTVQPPPSKGKGKATAKQGVSTKQTDVGSNGHNGAANGSSSNGNGTLGIAVGMSMREVEKKLIFETLRKVDGNRTKAAKLLSISIRTLRNKLNEYAEDGETFDFDAKE